MDRLLKAVSAALLAVVVASGCQPGGVSEAQDPSLGEPYGMVNVYRLAGLVGMRVTDKTATHVTLKNTSNTVLIFTTTDGKVYVNAKPVCEVGRIKSWSGATYVDESVVERIKSALRTSKPWTPPSAPAASGCVVIDAGHGGHDPGAISVLGYHEKEVNLSVADKLASILRSKGLKVVMTRDRDVFLELEDRAALSNRQQPVLFVSIHTDSFPEASRRGFTMYVSRSASWASRRAAAAISKQMDKTGLTNQGVQEADYRVLVKTTSPAVLVELGYLSNRAEARLLRTNSFQNRLAQALAGGIGDYMSAQGR